MGKGDVRIDPGGSGSSGESGQPDAPALQVYGPAGSDPGPTGMLLAALDDDSAIVDRFVEDFLTLLDQRVAGAGQLVRAGRSGEARTTLRSLEVNSRMLGADRLGSAAAELLQRVGDEPWPSLALGFDELQRIAGATRDQLRPPANR